MNSADLLADLNEPQRQAVLHTDGPLLVLAGPGSGKTRVITRRAAHLASTVTSPENVMAITFTNKAAREMRERIEALGLGGMLVSTFHSLGARLLRRYAARVNLSPGFSIFDESDTRQILKQALADVGLTINHFPDRMVRSRISDAKNRLILPNHYLDEDRGVDWEDRKIAEVYRAYDRRMTAADAVDFDDLLLKTAYLLKDHPDVRDALEARYRYVLIDEYQDTNHAQYMIARGLTLEHHNICATGDPDQSIYAWRGADIRNILEFEKDYPSARIVRLEQNYRSTPSILGAASTLIKANEQRKDKELWTENADGERVDVIAHESSHHEADFIVEHIREHIQGGGQLGDFAVLYRVNSLSRVIEESLLRAGISYQVARGTAFYNRKEIKDLLSYVRVVVNPADPVAVVRSLTTPPRGVGKTSIEHLLAFAESTGIPPYEAARRVEDIPAIRKQAAGGLKKYVAIIESLKDVADAPPAIVLERALTASGLSNHLGDDAEREEALDNIHELISAAAEFNSTNPEGTLAEWLEQVALVSDVDGVRDSGGAVTLMTLHAAKGLEYDNVVVIGLEEGLLPLMRQDDEPNIEEERRLLFVGMTRARRRLTMTHAHYRRVQGIMQGTTPSQFITELAGAGVRQLDTTEVEPVHRERSPAVTRPKAGDYATWKPGMYLRHPQFGLGQLLWKSAGKTNVRAGLRFMAYGEKTLVLDYAKLEPVDPDECQLPQ